MATKRLAFKMKIKPGTAEEYKKRHDEIWPELSALLKDCGVSDYSIFLDEDSDTLFAVQKIEDGGGSQALGDNPIVRKWWRFMADIMEVNEDSSPVSIPLSEVFFME